MASDLRFCSFGLSADDAHGGPVSSRLLAICWQPIEPHRNLTKLHRCRELSPGTGRWRQRSKGGFASRREAETALRAVLTTMDSGNYVSPSSLCLGDYLVHRWLPSIKTTIRASTHASYARIVRLHIVPRLGAVKLQALDPMMLNEFYGA